MKQLQVLIKPVSSTCNLKCTYCFYDDVCKERKTYSYGKMTEDVMEQVICKALEVAEESCTFGFQGGEPTLAGLSYYQKFVKTVNQYRKNQKIQYVLQTNGTEITEEWITFFKKEQFLVGISLDGTKKLHNTFRKDQKGKDTYLKVRQTAQKLQQAGIDVNVLCVLTKQAARHIRSIYQNFKEDGFYYQQYIPCIPSIKNENKFWNLSEKECGEALVELFDLWLEDFQRGTPIYIREFDQWVDVLKGGYPQACTWCGYCSMQNIVEADGSVYPCDFYVLEENCLGNIMEEDFSFEKNWQKDIFFQEGEKRGERCSSCKWYPLCRGGCRREYLSGENGEYHHRLCAGYRIFFEHAIPGLEWVAAHSFPKRRT